MVVANDNDLSTTSKLLPRVLIVSRRTLRKNKFVDFVGEYHLDLIVSNGAVPVIVPRVSGIHSMLKSFEPIHGVLLCEGEDVDPSLYTDAEGLSQEDMDEIRTLHASDTAIDREKDSIELTLARLCLERNIPFLGICRGSKKTLVKSFSMAELLEANTALSKKQENRLKQMGATVRNSCVYVKRKEVQERAMDKLSNERLSDLLSFHRMMARLCSDAIKRKLLEPTTET